MGENKTNLVIEFKAGKQLIYKYAHIKKTIYDRDIIDRDINPVITDIRCLNQAYGEECPSDWLYDIRIEGDSKTYMVMQNEIIVQLK